MTDNPIPHSQTTRFHERVSSMTPEKRSSYIFVFLTIVLVGFFKLGTPLITIFFAYFLLKKLDVLKKKWLTMLVFCAFVSILCVGLVYFLDQAVKTLPKVISTAVPAFIEFAQKHNLELPFTDWDSLKLFAMDGIKGELRAVGTFAKIVSFQFVFLAVGVVAAISLYLSPAGAFHKEAQSNQNNFYALYSKEIIDRFRSLYQSFALVMGAQLIISTINTGLTSSFLIFVHLPYAPLVIALTFLCGMLPIVGNLLSNSIIVIIAFTVSPDLALTALCFLVVLHKLEYFLNSKIIGEQIKNPVWLTLIGLIVGERLMGITGMILAPVILNFIKIEASQIKIGPPLNIAANAETKSDK
jgi:predicted PurR-regulated permease PerM